jgi:hypothetical protein
MAWTNDTPQTGSWVGTDSPLTDVIPPTLRYSELTTETYANVDWRYKTTRWDRETPLEDGSWV